MLPAQLTTFIGRHAERATVTELVAAHRLVTLTGSGGCGKTRLALQVARARAPEYAGGVWWIDLARIADGTLVDSTIAAALSIKETPGQSFVDTLTEHLRGLQALLVIDNCEHVIVSVASTVDALLSTCPQLSVLATSREPLGIVGEVAWRVPSLAAADAEQLFLERARRVRPDLASAASTTEAIASICARLDGIPLALELAAARVRMLTVHEIATGLDDRFRLLAGASRTAVPRHQALRASVDWSYDLLGSRERVVLCRLGVFAGGFTLEAAEEICAADDIARTDVLDLVGALVDRSLVQVDTDHRGSRYRLLETIRQYVLERLISSGDDVSVRARHRRCYRALAERAEPAMEGAQLLDWLAVLDAEHDNLRVAFDSSTSSGSDDCVHLAAGLWQFWMMRGHLTEGRRRIEHALRIGAAADPRARARALYGAGQLMINHGDLAATADLANQALAIARSLGDDRLAGRALDTLGYSAAFLDPPTAPRVFDESIALLRRAGDVAFLADAHNGLGIARFLAGDYPASAQALESGVACARESGNPSTLTLGLGVLGYTRALQGRLARARTHLREALATARRVRDPAFTAQALYALGLLDTLQNDHEPARAQLAESIALARAASPLMLAFALLTDGFARYIRNEHDTARDSLRAALDASRELGLVWPAAWSRALLGDLSRRAGALVEARASIDEALAVTKAAGIRVEVAIDAAARLARAELDRERAEALHHEALAAAIAAESVLVIPQQLEALAALAGDALEAARLFGAAEAAREAHGLVRYLADRDDHARDLAALETKLSAGELRAAWDDGRQLSLDEAVAYATRGRGERKRPAFGWASLTPTEIEVVRHVVRGLTNPEIAERLFVSRSTVKVHLSHIFSKLDVSTRSELAAEATRRGF